MNQQTDLDKSAAFQCIDQRGQRFVLLLKVPRQSPPPASQRSSCAFGRRRTPRLPREAECPRAGANFWPLCSSANQRRSKIKLELDLFPVPLPCPMQNPTRPCIG